MNQLVFSHSKFDKKYISAPVTTFIIIIGFILFAIPQTANATRYYVDPKNGDDANLGDTENTAWKTIEKVKNSSTINDEIYFIKANRDLDMEWPPGRKYYAKEVCKRSKNQGGPDYKCERAFLTSDGDLVFRTWNSGSRVKGSDGMLYICSQSHTSRIDTCPVTGDNYGDYWVESGYAAYADPEWQNSTSYASGSWADLEPSDVALNPLNRTITWTFDTYYRVGQFANMDIWVIGPVTITKIDPQSLVVEEAGPSRSDPTIRDYPRIINGSMINPSTSDYLATIAGGAPQAFDSELLCFHTSRGRIEPDLWKYTHIENVARVGDSQIVGPEDPSMQNNPTSWNTATAWDGKPIDEIDPVIISADSSLVSSYSRRGFWWDGISNLDIPGQPQIWFMAVLTVIDSIPPEGSFRPGVNGNSPKEILHDVTELDFTKLKQLEPVSDTPTLYKYTNYFARFQLDYWSYAAQNQALRAADSGPIYGQAIAQQTGDAALLLNLVTSNDAKKRLVISLVQLGLDNYQFMTDKKYDYAGTWWPGEGQHVGRKLPIIFAGYLLGGTPDGTDSASKMLNIGNWWQTADHVQVDGKWYMCTYGHVSGGTTQPVYGSSNPTSGWKRYWKAIEEYPEYPVGYPTASQQKVWSPGVRYSTGHCFQEDTAYFYVKEQDVNRYLTGINHSWPSVVEGTDGNIYRCFKGHTATGSDSQPPNGNWMSYWELTNTNGMSDLISYSFNAQAMKTWAIGSTYRGADNNANYLSLSPSVQYTNQATIIQGTDGKYYQCINPHWQPYVKWNGSTYLCISYHYSSVNKQPGSAGGSDFWVEINSQYMTSSSNQALDWRSGVRYRTGAGIDSIPISGSNWAVYWRESGSSTTNHWTEAYGLTRISDVEKPEWGSRHYGPTPHSAAPTLDDAAPQMAIYRDMVNPAMHSTILAAHIMGLTDYFAPALVDYQDRLWYSEEMTKQGTMTQGAAAIGKFTRNMWTAYREDYPPVWGLIDIPTPTQHMVTSSVTGTGGNINPFGAISVNEGSNRTFYIMPSDNYEIDDVEIDGISQGDISSYTFVNVTADHTISVSFAATAPPVTYTITANAGGNGSILPSGAVSVNQNSNQSFSFTPNTGYEIADVLVDGATQGPVSNYTFSNVTSNHSIQVNFAIKTYTISAGADDHGDINPSGSVTVDHGANRSFSFTADPGYAIEQVLVDGASQGAADNYIFTNVTANHTINVSFRAISYAITAGAGLGGIISPVGEIDVNQGSDQSFTITPDPGYEVQEVLVDGVSQGAVSSYTFSHVTAHHEISVSFNSIGPGDVMVGHWKLDETSGVLAPDSSGMNNTGALINGLSWTDGIDGGALQFLENNDAVEISTGDLEAGSGSIAMWIYPESFSLDNNYIFGHTTQPWGNRIQLYTSGLGGILNLGLGDNHSIAPNIYDLDILNWYHIALTWNGSDYVVYVNGSQAVSGSYSGLASLNTFADIGNNGAINERTEAFYGRVDDVRVFNYALSSSGVKIIFNATPPFLTQVQTPDMYLQATGAVVTWRTDIASTSQVEYGTDISYDFSTNLESSLVNDHYVQLSGLTPETLYHYRVRSQNSLGGETVSPDYTFTTKSADMTTYNIIATAQDGGGIDPNGIVVVDEGTNQTFVITADTGYEVEDVIVDEVSWGSLNNYTFVNVTENHTINATFAPTGTPSTHTITATAGPGGAITPSGAITVNQGSIQRFTFAAEAGLEIAEVVVDGVSLGSINSYIFTNVSSNHTIAVSFAAITYNITATSSAGGSITPSGLVQVLSGEDQEFAISAAIDEGYHIADVLVNGVSQGAISTFNFTDVTGDHNISASFALDTYIITTEAGEGGVISPVGPLTVNYGGSQQFLIQAEPGRQISDVVVDGVSQGKISSYIFNNIHENHSLIAHFDVESFIISAGTSEGGSITPNGEVSVTPGFAQEFLFLADPGYRIGELLIDGAAQPNPSSYSSYTFSQITANHTIRVNYISDVFIINALADEGGIITPSGNIPVDSGADQEFSISTQSDYHLVEVFVDGFPLGPITSYTFTNVASDHQISVITTTETLTISAVAQEHGTIVPGGDNETARGSDLSFVIIPENDYYCVSDVRVDGVSQGARTSYTFHDIAFDHTIEAVFALKNLDNTDETPPSVINVNPKTDDQYQAPLNSVISLHVIDENSGVDAESVTISINNNIVYSGGDGPCQCLGTETDFTFIYQPSGFFDFDQEIIVKVFAQDQAGNTMPEFNYSFRTEMRSFGENHKVNSSSGRFSEPVGHPASAIDLQGNIWVAWHVGAVTRRDIYLSKLSSGAKEFYQNQRIISDGGDQCNPVLALDRDNKLHLAWQDNRNGNWDIYYSSSADRINWSSPIRISDSDADQINPVIAFDYSTTPQVHIAWQDMTNNNWDIYLSSSSNGFVTKTTVPLTTNYDNQIEPTIAVDNNNNVYVAWTDYRNGNPDIYGASAMTAWNNQAIISNTRHKSSPVIDCESQGNILHLLWVEQNNNDKDIYYAYTEGFPTSPINGFSIVDDSSSSDQWAPALLVQGHSGGDLKVFAGWQDHRNIIDNNDDSDIYFAEASTQFGANLFIQADMGQAHQSQAILGMGPSEPYLIWVDDRTGVDELYYTATTSIRNEPVASALIVAAQGGVVGTDPSLIANNDDVSVEVPAGALRADTFITISKIENPPSPQALSVADIIAQYEFGPSWNLEFFKPVIITIPYFVGEFGDETALWYNPQTDQLSDRGITNIEHLVISESLHAIRFQTTHFTRYVVAIPEVSISGSGEIGSGGGGCSMSRIATNHSGVIQFFLPYLFLISLIWFIRLYDRKKRSRP